MILLDTNVISDLIKPVPTSAVFRWVGKINSSTAYISAITEFELRYGIVIMPSGQRRCQLANALETMLREDFSGRILPFDTDAASQCATIRAERRRIGRPIELADAQIASIARSRGAKLATRNEKDFHNCGITVLNPWTDRGIY